MHTPATQPDTVLAAKVAAGEPITAADITRALCPVCAALPLEVVAANGCTHDERAHPYVVA